MSTMDIEKLSKRLLRGGFILASLISLAIYFEAGVVCSFGWYVVQDNSFQEAYREAWLTARNILSPILAMLMVVVVPLAVLFVPTQIGAICYFLFRAHRATTKAPVKLWQHFLVLSFMLICIGMFLPLQMYWEEWQTASAGKKMLQSMPNNDTAEQMYRIQAHGVGNYSLLPFQTNWVTLEPLAKGPVDAIRWHLRVDHGVPQETWQSLFALHAHSADLIAKQKWLLEWRAADTHRIIEPQFVDGKGITRDHPEFFVEPAWRHAKFAGKPEFEILLRRNGTSCCTLYLSSQESRALLLNAKPLDDAHGEQGHWLDRQDVSFHPKSPSYIVVTANGEFQKVVIPEDDPILQATLKQISAKWAPATN
jgi:hypothetical protein